MVSELTHNICKLNSVKQDNNKRVAKYNNTNNNCRISDKITMMLLKS